MGIIHGFPDGTFMPDGKITYNELYKMLVSAFYTDNNTVQLSYPSDYAEIAKKEGFYVESAQGDDKVKGIDFENMLSHCIENIKDDDRFSLFKPTITEN